MLFWCVFPGPFCQDMYQTVVQMTNGPVIWAYLKPLIMGKILYSPDTPATRMLIQKVRAGTKASPHMNLAFIDVSSVFKYDK